MKVLLIIPTGKAGEIAPFAAELEKHDIKTQIVYLNESGSKNIAYSSVSAVCRLFEMPGYYPPMKLVDMSFEAEYSQQIEFVKSLLLSHPGCTALAIYQPAISILMKAGTGLENKLVFYENGDAVKAMFGRYGKRFIEKYYTSADTAVFSGDAAKNDYPPEISAKGVVIEDLTSPESILKWVDVLN